MDVKSINDNTKLESDIYLCDYYNDNELLHGFKPLPDSGRLDFI